MGGDPVTMELAILVVDEEVKKILEEAGFLAFFNKFKGHSEGVTRKFIDSWKEGRVSVDKYEFLVSAGLITEASRLPNEVLAAKSGKGKPPLHQGLMKMLVDFFSSKNSPAMGPSKGGFTREERVMEEPSPMCGKSIPVKGPTTDPSENVESPGGPFMVTEELKFHLRVLNSLGSSLSSTCACVNLLTIEVMNYLKEVLKIMKDKNLGKE
eukprot:Gb_31624 [translate_table: standard]